MRAVVTDKLTLCCLANSKDTFGIFGAQGAGPLQHPKASAVIQSQADHIQELKFPVLLLKFEHFIIIYVFNLKTL